jgi:hypothetical protein
MFNRMGRFVFWTIMPCSLEKTECFGGIYQLHFRIDGYDKQETAVAGDKLSSSLSSVITENILQSLQPSNLKLIFFTPYFRFDSSAF